jgi:small subunit ribosomal protein S17
MDQKRSINRKQLTGEVVSDAMDKTVIVKVERRFPHPRYNKYIKKSKRYYAHDEKNNCSNGDLILIEESKPISKNKRWVVKSLVKKSEKI